jgi:negative regulator of flagellin synthesis FlgM
MVDPIGNRPVAAGERRLAPVTAADPTAAPKPVAKDATTASQAQSATLLSHAMASEAPIDAERVARIRKAVQEGRYPISPTTIADTLLALKVEWGA